MFFFFKQKTAYELRISDWSSDVCSSDLPDAHHPSDPALTNRQLMIRGNLIQGVGRAYSDTAAVLANYSDGSVIIHNDISDAPSDGTAIGLGWGYVDHGGNPNYRARQRGYDSGGTPVWHTPTRSEERGVGTRS